MEGTDLVIIFETNWIDRYQVDIRRSENVMEVRVNNEKAKIGLQYQCIYNCEYNYTFILNKKQEDKWADAEEKLG